VSSKEEEEELKFCSHAFAEHIELDFERLLQATVVRRRMFFVYSLGKSEI